MSAAFSFAPASERTLSAGAYLAGSLWLAAVVVALAYAAWRVRRLLLPGWSGAPARLAEAVLAIAGAVWLSQLLGTVGLFERWPLLAGALAVALLAGLACARIERDRAPAPAPAPPAPPAGTVAAVLATIACAAVAAGWMVPTLASLAGGMDRADTLWYHMPLAARFLQGGSLAQIDHFDPIFFAAYYPANSEVLHAVPLLGWERDVLSPLLNLGFLALGLAAAYCIGRPWGVGPQALIGGAVALGSQQLVEFQAGEALNDIVGVALVLAAVALLVNAAASRAATPTIPTAGLAVAGIAAGLAAGTKLSFLAPVAALALGVGVIAARGARLRSFAWFALPAALAGGYWYLRNAIAIGNPIPFTGFGPLGLPHPERAFELREGFSVAHYWNDTEVWADWFVPGLEESFGVLWPLTLVAVGAAGLIAVLRGGTPLVRMLGAVVLFTGAAYLFTPLTAAGEEGEPIAFEWNVRYLAPGAAIALALLPALPSLRATPRRRTATLAGLAVLLTATVASLVQWQQGHVKGALAAGLIVLAGAGALAWLRSRGLLGPGGRRAVLAGLVAVAALGALGAGWWEQRHYLERRYENLSPALKLAEAVRWARDLRDARVAIGGVRGVFNQYPFYGTDLSNHVQWLGEEGPDGAFLRIPTCEGWREAINAGGYSHVVTTYDPFNPGTLSDTKEGLWTRRDPAAHQVLRDGPVSVFRIDGELDPDACGSLPDLSPPELNGDSVNAEPTANEPR